VDAVKLRKPAFHAPVALTVVGFLLISAAATVLGLIWCVLGGIGLGALVAGICCLLLSWLAEPEPPEPPQGGEPR
jgi:membrane-bound ClpP family serine protease